MYARMYRTFTFAQTLQPRLSRRRYGNVLRIEYFEDLRLNLLQTGSWKLWLRPIQVTYGPCWLVLVIRGLFSQR